MENEGTSIEQRLEALSQRVADAEATNRDLRERCESLSQRLSGIEAEAEVEDQSFSEWLSGLFGEKKSDGEQA